MIAHPPVRERGILTLLLGAALLACSEEPMPPARAVYVLCRENVASVDVVPAAVGGALGVGIQLTPAATEELAGFSGERVGSELEVTFADRVFVRAPIRRAIRSGLFINHGFDDASSARAARDEVRTTLPEAPCGPER